MQQGPGFQEITSESQLFKHGQEITSMIQNDRKYITYLNQTIYKSIVDLFFSRHKV